jgi:hypothetical protein
MGITKGTRLDTSQAVLIDIDRGTVRVPEGISLPSPPAPYTTLLNKTLHEIIQANNSAEVTDNKRVYLSFLAAFKHYFIEILWEAWGLLYDAEDSFSVFDAAKFMERQPDYNQPFWWYVT